MRLFKRADPIGDEVAKDLECSLTTFPVEPAGLLDRSAAWAVGIVDHARGEVVRLDREIAAKEEERRQARLVLATFEPTIQKLDEGYDRADDARKSYEVAIEAKRKRTTKPALEAAE